MSSAGNLMDRLRAWAPWKNKTGEPVTENTIPPVRVPRVAIAGERVYVWDVVVRLTHWLVVLSMTVLVVTGIFIGNPFIVPDETTTGGFLMAEMKVIHSFAAIVFTLSVVSRVVWMFIGPQYARWDQFLPIAPDRRAKLKGTLLFYLFIRRHPPPTVGHNPLAGATYVGVFAAYFLMILTGFALFSVSATDSFMSWFGWLLPIFGGAQATRWIHHAVMWLLVGFAIHHVASALLFSLTEKNGTMDSIFSGFKTLTTEGEKRLHREERRKEVPPDE